MQHVLSARQFDHDLVSEVFERTASMQKALQDPFERRELAGRHAGEVVATLFYEPSTRTRLSFESAAYRIGAGVISTENAKEFSSSIKGESLEDSIRTVERYASAIVLRHSDDDSSDRAAAASSVPILNAGSGKAEHPTQALLDMYTIHNNKHRSDNLHVVIGGDLAHGRTARSLAQLLSLYPDNRISFVSTPELQIGRDIIDHLNQNGTEHVETDDMFAAVRDADVVYWTRIQKERHAAPATTTPIRKWLPFLRNLAPSRDLTPTSTFNNAFTIDQAVLQEMKDDTIIMHPLPRNHEISETVDNDPRAKYFDQVENGMFVRMALLDMVLTKI